MNDLVVYVANRYRVNEDGVAIGLATPARTFTDPLQAQIWVNEHSTDDVTFDVAEVVLDMTSAPYDDWMDYLTTTT